MQHMKFSKNKNALKNVCYVHMYIFFICVLNVPKYIHNVHVMYCLYVALLDRYIKFWKFYNTICIH